MKVIFVTHPDAEEVLRGSFRPLIKKGIEDLKLITEDIISYIKSNKITNISLYSSIAVRCVQTVFELGNQLRENKGVVVSDKINTIDGLNQTEGKTEIALQLFFEDLFLKNPVKTDVTIVSVHADIGGALRNHLPESEVDIDGFLFSRPVFGILKISKNKTKVDIKVESYFKIP